MTGSPRAGLLVTGCHRAGTSLTMAVLSDLGVHIGREDELVAPGDDNPEGFFEHEALVRFDDELLGDLGGAWDLPPARAVGADDPRLAPGRRSEGAALLARLAVGQSWGWKDPRAAFLAAFWADVVDDLRVVICVRDPIEVAMSLKRRNRTSFALGVNLWRRSYDALTASVPESSRLVVHFDRLLAQPAPEQARLCGFAGLAPATISRRPDLHRPRQRSDADLREMGVDDLTIALYDRLCDEAGWTPSPRDAVVTVADGRADNARLRHRLARSERYIATLEQRAEAPPTKAAARPTGRDPVSLRLERLEDALVGALGGDDAPMWRELRHMVADHVPPGDRLLVIARDHPAMHALGREVENFPGDGTGRWPGFFPADDLGAIAQLEALRHRGAGWLLVPADAAWWFESYPTLAAHLRRHYATVGGEPGTLIDLRECGAGSSSLAAVVETLGATVALDCTSRPAALRLPSCTTFRAPSVDGALPYRDHTIPVVLIDVGAEPTDAVRVAHTAVIAVAHDRDDSAELVWCNDRPAADHRPDLAACVAGVGGRAWSKVLAASTAVRDLGLVVDERPVAEIAADDDAPDRLLIVDAGVTIVSAGPGSLAAAVGDASAWDVVVGKVYSVDGSLESAGLVRFDDRSWAPVAAGSFADAAGWHEFRRAVDGGTGIALVRRTVLADLDPADSGHVTHLTTALADSDVRVGYDPELAAVRVEGRPPEPTPARSCSPVARPAALDDASWPRVLAAYAAAGRGRSAGRESPDPPGWMP